MSEKLCLQWNDFQENVKSAFRNLREDKDFADVTLACEDDQQVEAHKVILAGKVLFYWLFHSHHHIKVIVEKQARGSSWAWWSSQPGQG